MVLKLCVNEGDWLGQIKREFRMGKLEKKNKSW